VSRGAAVFGRLRGASGAPARMLLVAAAAGALALAVGQPQPPGGAAAVVAGTLAVAQAPGSTPVLTLSRAQPAAGTLVDISSQILRGANVALAGDSVVNLPPGTTTYDGVLSGQGTLTVRAPDGPGTLMLSKDSDFTLPTARRYQAVTTTAGPHPYTTVSNPDPPGLRRLAARGG